VIYASDLLYKQQQHDRSKGMTNNCNRR